MHRRVLLVLVSAAIAVPLVAWSPSAGSAASGPVAPDATGAASSTQPYCELRPASCPDTRTRQDYEGEYVGHDEPSVLFYSNRAGSGNSNTWRLRIPREAPTLPNQSGTGGTWNFQQRATFWFGMALCETQSYPNPGAPCTPNSDANIKDDGDPGSPNWAGNHAGTGFLELQFYPPGWVQQYSGFSCDPTRWCAAMVVFGLSDSTTQRNNADCLERAGEEWADFAYLTRSGVPQGPPDPFNFDPVGSGRPGPGALYMNPGDALQISIHDSPAGLVTTVADRTSGQTGSMTASVANGFAHPLFQPDATTCTQVPYAFHPMYSTSTEHTRVPWAAHSYNVAFADEIGHFEYCQRANVQGSCVNPGVTDPRKDADDNACFNAEASTLIRIGGCLDTDSDFDGPSYQPVWPGTLADAQQDRALHSPSFVFTSPLTHGRNYSRAAFETDLPAIEPAAICDVTTGAGCSNPPAGAAFYPLYSTTGSSACGWQEGGPLIPGATNTFGGSSSAEYGPALSLYYPPFPGAPAGTSVLDFRRVLPNNPCTSSDALP